MIFKKLLWCKFSLFLSIYKIIQNIKNRPKLLNEKIVKKNISEDSESCLIISLADVHLDKLAVYEEVEEHSSIEKTKEKVMDMVVSLVSRGYKMAPFSKIILVGGHDFFNSDYGNDHRTHKGTKVDTIGNWQESFREGLDLMTDIIDYCNSYAPVTYYNIIGNHSPIKETHLAIALQAYYRQSEDIFIDTDYKTRKFFTYGNSSFFLFHGENLNIKDLPLIWATEKPQDFVNKFHYCLAGHLHHKKEYFFLGTKEHRGVEVKFMPSLSVTDKYHFEMVMQPNKLL